MPLAVRASAARLWRCAPLCNGGRIRPAIASRVSEVMLQAVFRLRAVQLRGRQFAAAATPSVRACAMTKFAAACTRPRSIAPCPVLPCLQPIVSRSRPSVLAAPLKRALSSAPAGGGGGGGSTFAHVHATRARLVTLLNAANENRFVLLTVGCALVAMYGFYKVTVKTMSFLLHVSDATIFNLGFLTGLIAAACVVAAAVATHRYTSLSVDGLKRTALIAAQQDYRVSKALGSQYFEAHPTFRAYTFETLRDALFGSERRARSSYTQLPARRCRLMFQVHGSVHDGVIAVEGFKRAGVYEIEAMSLFVTDTGEFVTLQGDEARSRHALFEDVLTLKTQVKRARVEDMENVDPFR